MISQTFFVNRFPHGHGRGNFKPGELKARFERRWQAFCARSDSRMRKRLALAKALREASNG